MLGTNPSFWEPTSCYEAPAQSWYLLMQKHAQVRKGRGKSDASLSSMACAGELRPDEGDAFIAGHSVISQLRAARQQLGYCPQVRPC